MANQPTYAYLVGARPNFMKMAPIIAAMRASVPDATHLLIHTGQHYDDSMSGIFFSELSLPEPDYLLGVGPGTHGEQTAAALTRVESVLRETKAEILVVSGDVNSTLAGALAATKLGVQVVHVESGLRSWDRSMPEEINRVLVDHIAGLCLVHSQSAVENLEAEGIGEDRIRFVGNSMIDSVVRHLLGSEESKIARALGVEGRPYLLVTLHRPNLVDSGDLRAVVDELEDSRGDAGCFPGASPDPPCNGRAMHRKPDHTCATAAVHRFPPS